LAHDKLDPAPEVPPYAPRLVTFDELRLYGVPLSKRQVDRLELLDLFPKRVPLSPGRVGWVTAEIIAHVDHLIAARSTKAGTLGSGGMMRTPPALEPKPHQVREAPRRLRRAARETESTA
jgi:predicted DNA-binding transcriptional regulator AlpA